MGQNTENLLREGNVTSIERLREKARKGRYYNRRAYAELLNRLFQASIRLQHRMHKRGKYYATSIALLGMRWERWQARQPSERWAEAGQRYLDENPIQPCEAAS